MVHPIVSRFRRTAIALGVITIAVAGALWLLTLQALLPVAKDLSSLSGSVHRLEVTDRHGMALNASYENQWNHHLAPLHEIPEFLTAAFIMAEDQRFYSHRGQDWTARLHALAQNLVAGRAIRGASTITEQVVRMQNPRPRTVWSRWLEGWEAARLEKTHGKLDILEFYLNQVPYAANRRGVKQAAAYYFDRDLSTLSKHEMLILAVLVRAPSRLDLFTGNRDLLNRGVARLAARMVDAKNPIGTQIPVNGVDDLDLRRPRLAVQARHFLRYATLGYEPQEKARLRTTLDGELQSQLQALLDERLRFLEQSNVSNGALLVADHQRGEILAWVVGRVEDEIVAGRLFDAVNTPRQPGSALKPFLYGLALGRGWTAATIIDDAPLAEKVGQGLHTYRNYSRSFYGPVRLRTALANSLNIPAVRAIQFTGATEYLTLLDELGFRSLNRHAEYYGDGLALGNAEVTLLELVQAYGAFANRGVYQSFAVRFDDVGTMPTRRVFSPEVASLIANILSDAHARHLEFGSGSLLNLPVQTAVKTGTSSDYRDSWAAGFNDRYVVGAWMGNLDQSPTSDITGSTGPALTLRGTFDLLNRHRTTQALWLSPRLRRSTICADTGEAKVESDSCLRQMEYFLPGTIPQSADHAPDRKSAPEWSENIRLRQPTPGLHLAYDPRIPDAHQSFEFVLQGVDATDLVEWRVNGADGVRSVGARYLWPVSRGEHFVGASIWREGREIALIERTNFVVK